MPKDDEQEFRQDIANALLGKSKNRNGPKRGNQQPSNQNNQPTSDIPDIQVQENFNVNTKPDAAINTPQPNSGNEIRNDINNAQRTTSQAMYDAMKKVEQERLDAMKLAEQERKQQETDLAKKDNKWYKAFFGKGNKNNNPSNSSSRPQGSQKIIMEKEEERGFLYRLFPFKRRSADIYIFMAFLFYIFDLIAIYGFPLIGGGNWIRSSGLWSYDSGYILALSHTLLVYFAWRWKNRPYENEYDREEAHHKNLIFSITNIIAVCMIFFFVFGNFKYLGFALNVFIIGLFVVGMISLTKQELDLSPLRSLFIFYILLFIDLYGIGYLLDSPSSRWVMFGYNFHYIKSYITMIPLWNYLLNRLFIPPLLFAFFFIFGSPTKLSGRIYTTYFFILSGLIVVNIGSGTIRRMNPITTEQIGDFSDRWTTFKKTSEILLSFKCGWAWTLSKFNIIKTAYEGETYDVMGACMKKMPLEPPTKGASVTINEQEWVGIEKKDDKGGTHLEWALASEGESMEDTGGKVIKNSNDFLKAKFGELTLDKRGENDVVQTSLFIASPKDTINLLVFCEENSEPLTAHIINKNGDSSILNFITGENGDTYDIECNLKSPSPGRNEVSIGAVIANVDTESDYKLLAMSKKSYDAAEINYKTGLKDKDKEKNPRTLNTSLEKFLFSLHLLESEFKPNGGTVFKMAYPNLDFSDWDSFYLDKIVPWTIYSNQEFPLIGIDDKSIAQLRIKRKIPDLKSLGISNGGIVGLISDSYIELRDGIEPMQKQNENDYSLCNYDNSNVISNLKKNAWTNAIEETDLASKLLLTNEQLENIIQPYTADELKPRDKFKRYRYNSVIDYNSILTKSELCSIKVTSPEKFINLKSTPEIPAILEFKLGVRATYIVSKKFTYEIAPGSDYTGLAFLAKPVDNMKLPPNTPKNGLAFGSPRPEGRTQEGIDLETEEGKPVYSVYDHMTVDEVGCWPPYGGNGVRLITDNGKTRILYLHLKEISVKKGQVLENAGTKIGTVGTTYGCFTDDQKSPCLNEQCAINCPARCYNQIKNTGYCTELQIKSGVLKEFKDVAVEKCAEYCNSCGIPYKTIPHLHFEVRVKTGDDSWSVVNPDTRLRAIKESPINTISALTQ